MELMYKGILYKAKNSKEMMKVLRTEARLTYQKIGDLVGCSRAYVGYILNTEYSIYGNLDFPELRNEGTFQGKTDEIIANELDLNIFRVIKARTYLGVKKHNRVRVYNRRKQLIKDLFGEEFKQGKDFAIWFDKFVGQKLKGRQYEVIKEFYIDGLTESTSEKINSDSNRVYRSVIKKNLKLMIADLDFEKLIKRGILETNIEDNGSQG